MSFTARTGQALTALREKNPLVVNVTNNVVTNFTANVLLALGASPAMSHAADDAAQLAGFAAALVLNMGTPAPAYVESMLAAAAAANASGAPVVFDPVACGATAFRGRVAESITDKARLAVIRGNPSEIMHLAGQQGLCKGVDSVSQSGQAVSAATAVAQRYGAVVSVSGATDLVTDGRTVLALTGGHAMMTRVTGMGCAATAVTAAFAAVNPDRLEAAAQAMAVMSLCGQMAAGLSAGPGSMAVNFLDALYLLDPDNLSGLPEAVDA